MSNVTKRRIIYDGSFTSDLSNVGIIKKLEKWPFHLKCQGICC